MKIIPNALVLLAVLYTSASYCAPPFQPQAVPTTQDSDRFASGEFTRLQISISSDEIISGGQVIVGNVTACSESACYRPQSSKQTIALSDTTAGRASSVIQFRIPTSSSIRSIHFDSIPGENALIGDVDVYPPLTLPPYYQGGSVLVLTRKTSTGRETRYSPTKAVGSPYHPELELVYYNPRFETVAHLKLGVVLTIPKAAVHTPLVLNVAVHDVLKDFPMIDIHPVVEFRSPASIRATNLKLIRGGASAGSVPEPGDQAIPPSVNRSIMRTGTFQIERPHPPLESATTPSTAPPSCVTFLRDRAAQISSELAKTGAVYLAGCETVPPYVHIAIANNADSRIRLSLSYNLVDSEGIVALQMLETWAPQSQIMMNGFTWVGDFGIRGGFGKPRGYVQSSDTVLGSNRVKGGTVGDYDSNKLAFLVQPGIPARWKEGFQTQLWKWGVDGVNYPFAVASSSTSIFKNGACSTSDTTQDRWSAFGTTSSKRLLFISSTAAGSTSAYDLCPVFQALGADFAIRLDGSTATGLAIDGARMNPISGPVTTVYGTSRYVAYALKVGNSRPLLPPLTPVIGVDIPTPTTGGGTVPKPSNPCTTNPRSCQ